ncbi:RRPp/PMC2 like exosome 3'-5' exoribonuclease subunit [Cryptosporidium canis]|nr:RRPp/PMC2 like exosome 3'-5' exoribonuclease subunit [Cryptosporidium canis]
MTDRKRDREDYVDDDLSFKQKEIRVDAGSGESVDEGGVGDLDVDVEAYRYISDNVLVSPGCESCQRLKGRAVTALSDSEKSLMVQVLWSNLINNFTFKFIPRLLSKPYGSSEVCPKFNRMVERLILRNVEEEDKRVLAAGKGNSLMDDLHKTYFLACQHPGIYSTSIQCLAPVGTGKTGIALIDDLGEIIHSKELILCQKFLDRSPFQLGNIYKYELMSLVWSVNETVYHTGEDSESEYYCSNKGKANNAHFNIRYLEPSLYLPMNSTPLTLVKEPEELRRMINDVLDAMEAHYNRSSTGCEDDPFLLAIDVEHHSNQSFKGFVSLIQLSTRGHDYIIDPFNLFNELQELNELTANPRILKVLHGSDYDIIWLQRDFSVYIVNMFDTGRAARILNTPGGFSLKNLLSIYCSIDVDKRFQLADWRERPLTNELIEYARGDTHYLLYVYDIMRNLLLLHASKKPDSSVLVSDAFLEVVNDSIVVSPDLLSRFNLEGLVYEEELSGGGMRQLVRLADLDPSAFLTAMHNSRRLCLKEYFEKPIDIWNLCYGIRTKMSKSSLKTPIDSAIVTLLSYYLFIWRESLARLMDVSANYVLKESMVIKICHKQPTNNNEILSMYPSIPANLKRHSEYILNIVIYVKSFVTSKSEDEIFDFNSYISHIYSNIANSDTNSSNACKSSATSNHGLLSSSDVQIASELSNVAGNGSTIVDNNDNKSTLQHDPLENIQPKSDQGGYNNIEGTPTRESTKRRSVTIKKSTSDSMSRFADNLFGSPKKASKSELDSSISVSDTDKGSISDIIHMDINNTLSGELPDIFKNKSMNASMKDLTASIVNSEQPKEVGRENNKTFEEYYSEKVKEETSDDESSPLVLSIREQFNEDTDYLYKKQKAKKVKSEDSQTEHSVVSKSPNKMTQEDEDKISGFSNLIKENASILPASITCKSDLPDFIKNSQKVGVPSKSKKFVESMKTKKWHKKR